MKSLKIVQSGWEGYTGWLGPVQFENGVSIEPTTDQIANQLSGIVSIEEVMSDGSSQVTGVTEGMVQGKGIAYIETPLVKVSQEEADAERQLAAEKASKPSVEDFHSVEQLEAIASEKGINGLREIGNLWGVRERSIPKLIRLILEAQEDLKSRLKGGTIVAGPAVTQDSETTGIPEDEVVIETVEDKE